MERFETGVREISCENDSWREGVPEGYACDEMVAQSMYLIIHQRMKVLEDG
jgi:hypothetical protein